MATVHLLSTLLPREYVKLGRLVKDPESPHEGYIDPLSGRPGPDECQKTHQVNYKETRKFSGTSKLRTYLSDDLSFSLERLDGSTATLCAPKATRHDLQHSEAWLTNACDQVATQKFLQEAQSKGQKIYLVVGFRTVQDPKVMRGTTQERGNGMKCEIPTGFGATGLLGSTPSTGSIKEFGNNQELSFQTPDEQVFAVLYHRVKFTWLSKRAIGSAGLEGRNRWVSSWDRKNAGDGAGEAEDDVLEASLTDSSDMNNSDDEGSHREPDSLLGGLSSGVGILGSYGGVNKMMGNYKGGTNQDKTEVTDAHLKGHDGGETSPYSLYGGSILTKGSNQILSTPGVVTKELSRGVTVVGNTSQNLKDVVVDNTSRGLNGIFTLGFCGIRDFIVNLVMSGVWKIIWGIISKYVMFFGLVVILLVFGWFLT